MAGSPRIDSPTASSDCRTCKQRRITCDRAIPACRKCGTRSLECPGYGLRLRWVQGPAVRGYQTALSLSTKEPFHEHALQSAHQLGIDLIGDDLGRLHSSQSSLPVLESYDDTSSRHLLYHYARIVAPQMVWVDSAHNPFVTVMIPLALQSPALMMSILSISAGDLWLRTNRVSLTPSQHWQSYQERAFKHLAQYLKDENHELALIGNRETDRASPILAAFLLGSLGLKLGSSATWRLHTRAAWTMIEHWNSCQAQSSIDDVQAFLLSEVYSCKVWESVTNFRPLNDFGKSPPPLRTYLSCNMSISSEPFRVTNAAK